MPVQLSFLPQLFACDGYFNVARHGEARYVVKTVFWPNGRSGNRVEYSPRFLCEECMKELSRRRKENDILDRVNDFEVIDLYEDESK